MKLDRQSLKIAGDLQRAKSYVEHLEHELEIAKQRYSEMINQLPTGSIYPITSLNLSEATTNRLYKAGYSYVYELILITSPYGFMRPASGIGEKTLKEISKALETFEVTGGK